MTSKHSASSSTTGTAHHCRGRRVVLPSASMAFDTCGHPIEHGALKRIGPQRKLHYCKSGSSRLQQQHQAPTARECLTGHNSTATAAAAASVAVPATLQKDKRWVASVDSRNYGSFATGHQPHYAPSPHRMRGLDLSQSSQIRGGASPLVANELSPSIGADRNTIHRGKQLLVETNAIQEKVGKAMRNLQGRMGDKRSSSTTLTGGGGAPLHEQGQEHPYEENWEFMKRHHHGNVSSRYMKTEGGEEGQSAAPPLLSSLLENERKLRGCGEAGAVRIFHAGRNPVQVSTMLGGVISNTERQQLEGRRGMFRVAENSKSREARQMEEWRTTEAARLNRVRGQQGSGTNLLQHNGHHHSGHTESLVRKPNDALLPTSPTKSHHLRHEEDTQGKPKVTSSSPHHSVLAQEDTIISHAFVKSPARTNHAERPSEQYLGSVARGKAYPYLRQLNARNQLDVMNMSDAIRRAMTSMH